MQTLHWPKLTQAATVIVAIVAISGLWISPAWGGATIAVDPGRLPVLAAAVNDVPGAGIGESTDGLGQPNRCGMAPATSGDQDVWVFRLVDPPGADAGAIVSASASFLASGAPNADAPDASTTPDLPTPDAPTPDAPTPDVPPTDVPTRDAPTPDASQTVTVFADQPGDRGGVIGRWVWITAPSGLLLTAASADITGDAGRFQLVAACPAEALSAPDPLAVTGLLPSAAPAGTASSAPTSQPTGAAARRGATGAMATLPVAGTDVADIVTLGAGLVLTGVLLILGRGRRPRPFREPEEEDIRRPVIMPRRP